jgi:ribosomal protein S7
MLDVSVAFPVVVVHNSTLVIANGAPVKNPQAFALEGLSGSAGVVVDLSQTIVVSAGTSVSNNPLGAVKSKYVPSSSVEIVKPFCEIKSLKIGGSNYKVPTEIHPVRQRVLAIKFIVSNSNKRNEKFASYRIAMEIFDTFSLSSQSIKKCDDVHKIAEANKVYIQYRN